MYSTLYFKYVGQWNYTAHSHTIPFRFLWKHWKQSNRLCLPSAPRTTTKVTCHREWRGGGGWQNVLGIYIVHDYIGIFGIAAQNIHGTAHIPLEIQQIAPLCPIRHESAPKGFIKLEMTLLLIYFMKIHINTLYSGRPHLAPLEMMHTYTQNTYRNTETPNWYV